MSRKNDKRDGTGEVRTSTLNNSEGEFLRVPLDSIVIEGINPRRTFDEEKLQELTASVREKGVLEPLLVRPLAKPKGKGRYGLIAGERRFKAAQRANLKTVPVIARNYTDQEALEIAVIENEQRADVPVLEKAEGYQKLMKEYGYSAEQLAAKISKSEAHVHSTVKLLIIPEFARQFLNDGTISKSHAEIIARVPNEEGRERLAGQILYGHESQRGGKKNLSVCTVREAKSFADRFTKELSKAKFDTTDPTLNPEIGACTTCPFKSGNNRLEYPEGRADVCNNVPCYEKKEAAARAIKLRSLEATGVSIIPENEVKKMMPYGDYISSSAGFVELKGNCWQDSKHRPYKQLVGKHVQLHVAIGPRNGEIFELAKRSEVDAALLKIHGIKVNGRSTPSKEQAEQKLRSKARANIIPLVLEKVATSFQRLAVGGFAAKFDKSLRTTTSSLLERIESDALRMVCKRRGIEATGEYPNFGKLLRARLNSMSGPEIYGLITECIVASPLHSWKSYYASDIRSGVGYEEIFKTAGVDLKALEREELQLLKQKKAERESKSKKAAAKKGKTARQRVARA